jgi:hypothetical protein
MEKLLCVEKAIELFCVEKAILGWTFDSAFTFLKPKVDKKK